MILVKFGILVLNIIYFFIKLFPQRKRITFISRQSNKKSDDISLGRDYYDITPNIENSSGCWVYGDYKAQIELVKK